MKELILSTVEREFILKAIGERKRLDGRQAYDVRRMNIQFGVDCGCCIVDLGDTKVMAQVSCEVTAPKDSRPNEGIIVVNIELSPMAAPHFEAGRRSDEVLELQRLLEHCLWESRCIDTESLCITTGLRVWTIRVDVHVLNYDGNVIDAASVAATAALLHFRRPDVSVSGEDFVIHSPTERDPLPLSVVHIPLSVTFAFFDSGQFMLVDPTQREQLVADGAMVVSMNKHREICMLETSGCVLLTLEQVTRCTNIAAVKVTEVTELIQRALDSDAAARLSGQVGMVTSTVDVAAAAAANVEVSHTQTVDMEAAKQTATTVLIASASDDDSSSSSSVRVISAPGAAVIDSGVAVIGEGGASSWTIIESEMDEDIELIETSAVAAGGDGNVAVVKATAQSTVMVDSDSEEETVVVLDSNEASSLPTKLSSKKINLAKAVKRKQK